MCVWERIRLPLCSLPVQIESNKSESRPSDHAGDPWRKSADLPRFLVEVKFFLSYCRAGREGET